MLDPRRSSNTLTTVSATGLIPGGKPRRECTVLGLLSWPDSAAACRLAAPDVQEFQP